MKSGSPSRLSAFAPPFNLDTRDHDSSSNSFLLDKFNLEEFYDHGSYVPYDDEAYPLHADSIAMPVNNVTQIQPSSCSAIAASLSYNSFLKQDEFTLSYSSEYNSSPAKVMRLSGANKTLPLLKPDLAENMDFRHDDAVINSESYSGRLSGTVDSHGDAALIGEPHVLLNAEEKVGCHERVPIVGKEEHNGVYVINEAIDPLVTAKSELLITSPDVPDVLSLESCVTKSGVPVHNSPELLDQNDSDVDSPCWKGTGGAYQSTFQVTWPVSSQLPKMETETRKTLNPLAPHFFPGSAKPPVKYHENECLGNDPLFIMITASPIVALSSKEHSLTDSLKAGTCPSEVSNVIGTQSSNDIHDGGKEYALPDKSIGCSVINSLPEDDLTSYDQNVMVPNVAASVKGIKDNIHNGSSGLTFGVAGKTPSCSRCVVSSDVDETLRGAPKSKPPKLDVELVINTMHNLSELLIWNYSNDLDSISEHEHDMIRHIINNLYVCMTNEVGQRSSIPESAHPCTSYGSRKLSHCHKVTKMKALTVPHDWELQKSRCTKSREKVQGPSSPINNEGIKKGDEIIGKTLEENHQIMEELPPQPLLYGKSEGGEV